MAGSRAVRIFAHFSQQPDDREFLALLDGKPDDKLITSLEKAKEYAAKRSCERGIDLDALQEGNRTELRNEIISYLKEGFTLPGRQIAAVLEVGRNTVPRAR